MRKDIFKLGILIVLAAFSAFSCQKEIDINTSALENQYVIEGAIKVGQLPYVILTKTGFLYDPIDVAALEEAYIHGAVVTVTDGSKTVTLSEVCYKNYNFFLTTELIDSLANLGGTTPDSLRVFLASLSNAQMESLLQFFGVPADVLSNIP